MKRKKIVPKFKNEDAEREFWSKNDPLDYFEENDRVEVDLSYLKPSTQSITLRVPKSLISDAKILANKRDIPYQSMLKIFLIERISQEYKQIKNK